MYCYGQYLPLPLKYMLQFIAFILKKNYFKFRDTYLQIHGTVMGPPFAPNYANIFMDYIERRILDSAPDNKKPILWLRFIDAIFSVWTYDHYSLHQFFEYMNIIHPTINFERCQSTDRIPFLGTLVLLNNSGDLQTTLYKKLQMPLHYFMQRRSILTVAKRALSIVRLSDIAVLFLMMMILLTI